MFEKCIKCERLGKDCFPNIYSMNMLDVRDFAMKLKEHKRISNGELSKRSGVPKGTIDMHFKQKNPYSADVNYSTFAPIICALIGCDEKEMECPPSMKNNEEKCDLLISEYEKKVEYLKKQVQEEHRISERRARAMYILGTILLVLLMMIIAALIVDALNKDLGFLWTN